MTSIGAAGDSSRNKGWLRQGFEFLSDTSATLTGVLVVWIASASFFASRQEIWVDETTQLSGLRLNPIDVLAWLRGVEIDRFVVPGDRMPPVSYWLGWLWSQVFGLDETSLRAMGIACVAGALALTVLAARKAFGPAAGWVTGLSLALSPSIVVTGVEVRAYPLFLLAAGAVFWCVVSLSVSQGRTGKLWVALGCACTLASYTHFFGVLLTGAAFVACLPLAVVRPSERKAFALCVLGVGLSYAGLIPFIVSAQSISRELTVVEQGGGILRSTVRLAYRTLGGHASAAVYPWIQLPTMLGSIGLFGLGLAARKRENTRLGLQLGLALAAAGMVAAAAKLATSGFDAFSPNYNVWMLPLVAIIVGSALAASDARIRRAAGVLAAAMLAGNLAATVLLLGNAQAFAHGAGERLIEEVERAGGPTKVAVVHDGSGDWGALFFPFYFVYRDSLPQYVAEIDGSGQVALRPIRAGGPTLEDLATRRVLLVSSRAQGAEEIKTFLRKGERPLLLDPSIRAALRARGHNSERGALLMAFEASEAEWFTPQGTALAK